MSIAPPPHVAGDASPTEPVRGATNFTDPSPGSAALYRFAP